MKKYKKPKKAKNRTAIRNQVYRLIQIEDQDEFDKEIKQMSEEELEAFAKELSHLISINQAKADAIRAQAEAMKASIKMNKNVIQKLKRQLEEEDDEALILASEIDLIHR